MKILNAFKKAKGRWPLIQKVFVLVPELPIFMQMRNSNLRSVIGQNSTVLIGWNRESWLVVMELL